MVQHGRPSITPVRTRLQKSGYHLSQKQKNKSPLVCLSWPRSSVVAHLSSLFPHRMLVGLTRRALPPRQPCALPHHLSVVDHRQARRYLAMIARAHMSWHLRSSPIEPRAPKSMASAGGARTPPDPT
jgi:hypothetical protein